MSQIGNFQRAQLNFNASGDNTIIAAAGVIKVWKVFLTVSGAVNMTMKSGSTVLAGPYIFTANGSSITLYYDGDPHYLCPPGSAFVINLTGSVTVSGQIHYTVGG